jgi:hypothetical protein
MIYDRVIILGEFMCTARRHKCHGMIMLLGHTFVFGGSWILPIPKPPPPK